MDIALSPNPNPINEEEPPEEAALRGVFINERTVNIASNAKDDFGYYIRYTTDGTTPTADSPVYVVEDGVLLTETCTVKAKVFDGIATGDANRRRAGNHGLRHVPGPGRSAESWPVDLGASTHDSILCTASHDYA
ncbi:MAG: chitobiase/beta-hexosaminidase C-terminal domain-containing protein [Lentisphaeria bacterium]